MIRKYKRDQALAKDMMQTAKDKLTYSVSFGGSMMPLVPDGPIVSSYKVLEIDSIGNRKKVEIDEPLLPTPSLRSTSFTPGEPTHIRLPSSGTKVSGQFRLVGLLVRDAGVKSCIITLPLLNRLDGTSSSY